MKKEEKKSKEQENQEEEKKNKAVGEAYDQFISLERKEKSPSEVEMPNFPTAYINIEEGDAEKFKVGKEMEATFVCSVRGVTEHKTSKGKRISVDIELRKMKF